MPTVDLIYDADCPNIMLARTNLLRAFALSGLTPKWSEHRLGDPDAPERVRRYGSPTVLVDGRDVMGVEPGAEASCRIYPAPNGFSRAPSPEHIAEALSRSSAAAPPRTTNGGGWRSGLAVVPGIGVAMLPKVACPACWPAYAGVLSSLGLGFLMDTQWLLPLTAVFLVIAVGALAFRARRRRGFGPFSVGVVAAAVVLGGKFAFDSDAAMYAGLGLLVAASIWNSWPRRAAPVCPACVTP